MDLKQLMGQWLIDESTRNKALLKHEIKLLENRLQKMMGDGKNLRLRTQEAAQCCSDLSIKYANLVALLKPDDSCDSSSSMIDCGNSPSRCYAAIQTLKQQIYLSMTVVEEIKIIRKLKQHYDYLQIQLNGLQPQSIEYIQYALTGQLKTLLESTSCADLLLSMVAFANDAGEGMFSSLALVAQLNDDEILQFANLLKQQELTVIINNIFFYKFNPQQLFKQMLHPEKLLSVKARLTMLHQLLENLYQIVTQTLKQRGLGELPDRIFHGNELLQGVTINLVNDAQDLIITALKEWRISTVTASDSEIAKNKLADMFLAYKFWFNPDRLIDTIMSLQQQFGCSPENYKKFFQDMLDLFQQLSTTECMDLYGYFANKDSCYLMRSLAAMLEDQRIATLPLANHQEKQAIDHVYHALDCVMESLREELMNRGITTIPYARHSTNKPLKPGRRNLDAIKRAMTLYSNPLISENQTLEQLFKEIGGDL